MSTPDDQRLNIEKAIAVLETQRALLGNDVVDTAVAPLRAQLAALGSAPAFQQQRKLATILFMDIVGSTAIVRDLDPEDNSAVMDTALMKLAVPVMAHGGRTTRFMGDGFKAIFGVPTARENDPEMAVRAGLAILSAAEAYAQELARDWNITGFAVRVGISTGLVMVGGGSEAEDTIMGTTVNKAARLESAAAPGTVLISAETRQLVRDLFELEPVASIQAKGFHQPVPAYRVLGAKTQRFRIRGRGVRGIRTKMLGRDREFARLRRAFRQAADDRARQMITVVAEAGMGKSRLFYEFEDWLAEQPEQLQQFKGRARPETRNMPYGLVRSLLGLDFDIWDNDAVYGNWTEVETHLLRLLGEMKTHFIGRLLGYGYDKSAHLETAEGDPRQVRDRALRYLVDYFTIAAATGPVVIFLDDIHWADDSSLDVVRHLAMAMPDQPLIFLAATRPDLYVRRPDWDLDQAFYQRLDLQDLSRSDSERFIGQLLDRLPVVPETLRNLVVNHAEGNPFFVEETINMLIDDGIIITSETDPWSVDLPKLNTKRIPPTLAGVLQARLDRLPPGHQQGIHQAAVVGRQFWQDIVLYMNQAGFRPVLDEADIRRTMSLLTQRQLIVETSGQGPEAARSYRFRHGILRDVAYQRVLRRHRRVYHGLVANWLITHELAHENDIAGQIADHLLLSESPQRALPYLLQAGAQAADQYANEEALNFLSQALALIGDDDLEGRYQALLKKVEVNDLLGRREAQKEDLALLDEIANASGEPEKRIDVLLQKANLAQKIGEYNEAARLAQQAVDLARARENQRQAVAGYIILGRASLRIGRLEAAQAYLLQAFEQGQEIALGKAVGEALLYLGNVAHDQADYQASQQYYERSLDVYRSVKDLQGESGALGNLGIIAFRREDFTAARAYAEQALQIFQTTGDRQNEGRALNNLGVFAATQHDLPAAKAYYNRTLVIFREIGDRAGEARALFNLAEIAHIRGNYQEAYEFIGPALAIRQGVGDRIGEARAWQLLGEIQLALGALDAAETALNNALALRETLAQPSLTIATRAVLARVALLQGAFDQAEAQTDIVLRFLDAGGDLEESHWPARDYLTCHQVLKAKRDPRAQDLLARAHADLQEQVANLADAAARHDFLATNAINREIVRLWEAIAPMDDDHSG